MVTKKEIILRLSKKFSHVILRGVTMEELYIGESITKNAVTVINAMNVGNGVIIRNQTFVYATGEREESMIVSTSSDSQYVVGYKAVMDEEKEIAEIVRR